MTSESQRITDVFYLALVCWREDRGGSTECLNEVAHSVLNRVRHRGWWGHDVASVVTQRYQYSSMTAAGDPQLTVWPTCDEHWATCLEVAAGALDGKTVPKFTGADSYHDVSIPDPYWAKPEMFCGQIGRLRFFNTDADHPEPGGSA